MRPSLFFIVLSVCFLCYGENERFIRFSAAKFDDDKNLPSGWYFRSNFATDKPTYKIMRDPETNVEYLRLETGTRHSGVLIKDIRGVLEKYPVMRWKWRVNKFPVNGDSRTDIDDQAISVCVGSGIFSTDSIAYRWETLTPKNHEGSIVYASGLVRVKYHVVHNQKDGEGIWYVETRNVVEEFQKAYGFPPYREVALSICCNSQFSKSSTCADVEYIEFLPLSALKAEKEQK